MKRWDECTAWEQSVESRPQSDENNNRQCTWLLSFTEVMSSWLRSSSLVLCGFFFSPSHSLFLAWDFFKSSPPWVGFILPGSRGLDVTQLYALQCDIQSKMSTSSMFLVFHSFQGLQVKKGCIHQSYVCQAHKWMKGMFLSRAEIRMEKMIICWPRRFPLCCINEYLKVLMNSANGPLPVLLGIVPGRTGWWVLAEWLVLG